MNIPDLSIWDSYLGPHLVYWEHQNFSALRTPSNQIVAKKKTFGAWSTRVVAKGLKNIHETNCTSRALWQEVHLAEIFFLSSQVAAKSINIQRRICPYIRSCYQTQIPATRSPVVQSKLTATQLLKHVWHETEMRKRFRGGYNGFWVFFEVRTICKSNAVFCTEKYLGKLESCRKPIVHCWKANN